MSLPAFIREKDGDLWLTEVESGHLRLEWKLKRVLHYERSPFQEIAIVETETFGKALVLDGVVQTTVQDEFIYNEMISHVPLAVHPRPERVLVIGGGDGGVVRECLKYPSVRSIDMVEIDERVTAACYEHLPELAGWIYDPRVRLRFEDGVAYVRDCKEQYDVVIVDSSDPFGPATALFQEEFYRNVRRVLLPGGVMTCQSESPLFYMPVLKNTYRILSELFPVTRTYWASVPTYPGGLWTFTLASLGPDPGDGGFRERIRDGETRYVTADLAEASFALPAFVRRGLAD
ncbi:MAG: polyamine aminopropyltransferase [Alicyclobacillaceae bacterium]|nr:polyamine aminopropyltransferase [Alicyclobacillaceae bacterium]